MAKAANTGPRAGSEATLALGDLRVVELPCLEPMPCFAAPMAGKALADLGAEVVKVEPPKVGAAERRHGPFRADAPGLETSGLHLYLNTNKLGVTLDLFSPRARELLLKLLDGADIVLNPNRPALNQRLDLRWRGLVERFPSLVVVSLTCFGTESPYRDFPGSDLIAAQMSGVGYDTPINQVTSPETQPPLKPGERQADYLCGLTAAAAAMCALAARAQTGRGQHVDVSEWLATASMSRPSIGVASHEASAAPHYQRLQSRAKLGFPWLYPCRDGWVSFSSATDRFWPGTKRLMGNPEWAEEPMFSTLAQRAQHADAIEAALIDFFADKPRQWLFENAQKEHVPCFPVNTPGEAANNVQYRAREFFAVVPHPEGGEVRIPGAPYKLSGTPWRIRRAAPRLGEHNRLILSERLKLDAHELADLQAQGIV